MYLKEIVLNGFKSFADRTSFLLDGKTTCIVGPNGSGKSNIVDAVRWVLGEQSVKSLRGEGSMSDVIFAGSTSRKPKNVASVELVFDNSDHYLNVNYTEVSIKRRVYRSGENEYFINNEHCRLKDITNLFLDSAVSKESFNIISQGEVQLILSESKEDRRLIFEEAAGVIKYKKRKEEALRKLDKTHEAMERVEDIISELEKELTPLKKQKEDAKVYLDTKKELEKTEIALLAYDIYQDSEKEKQLELQKKSINNRIVDLTTNSNISDKDILKYKTDQLKLEKDLQFIQKELLTTTEDATKLDGKIEVLKANRNMSLKEEKISQLYEMKNASMKEVGLLEDKINQEESSIMELREILERDKKQLSNLKLSLKQARDEEQKHDHDIINYNHKIELLRLEYERGDNMPPAVKAVLNANLNGIYDTIGRVMSCDQKYSKALDIASSSSKNFLIAKDEFSAKEAISYLKGKKLGRATFFPLTVIEGRNLNESVKRELAKEEGYCGVLTDFIKCEIKYLPVIENQFGLVLVVEDMDSALRISAKMKQRYKIVTLDGDVVHVGGSMTGGSTYKSRSSVTIKQEIESCESTVKALQEMNQKNTLVIESTNRKITALEDEIFDKQKEEDLLREKIELDNDALKNAKEELEKCENSLVDLESDGSSLDEKEQQLVKQYYDKTLYKEKLESSQKIKQGQLEELKKQIENLETEAKYQNNLLHQEEDKLKNLEIEVNKLSFRLDHMLETLSTEYTMTYEKAKKEYELEVEPDEARELIGKYKAKLKLLGVINLAAIDEYDRINERYSFLLHQKEDLETAKNTLLQIMDEMDNVMKEEFKNTFDKIKEEFQKVFKRLFHGGNADLKLTNPDDLLTTGIEIISSPPGKKLSTINLLSGGEKTLTAISLLFAILNVRKVPFCIFDEIEAALDEANVAQFGKYLDNYKDKTQFLIITHKKKTMEYADTLYGITMQEEGVSKLVSVKLTNYEELI